MFSRFGRPILFAAVLAGLVAYGTIMLHGPHGLNVLAEQRRTARALESENADMQREINQKRKFLQKLSTDPNTQEIEIKKILGWQRKDETVFKSSDATHPTPK